MVKLTIGADPELFVLKDGKFISGHIFPCGNKYQPKKTKNGSIQVDGMALEVNMRPATSKKMFVKNIRSVINDLTGVIHKIDKSVSLQASPVAFFDREYLESMPIYVKALGCEPDFDAYSGGPNPKPNGEVLFRTGAGHIHLGWGKNFDTSNEGFLSECREIAKQLDFYLGLPSLLWDTNATRRELYGRPGAFRPKKYGMEYRVLSNAWLQDQALVEMVFSNAKKAFVNFHKGERLNEQYPGYAQWQINRNHSTWHNFGHGPRIAEAIGLKVR